MGVTGAYLGSDWQQLAAYPGSDGSDWQLARGLDGRDWQIARGLDGRDWQLARGLHGRDWQLTCQIWQVSCTPVSQSQTDMQENCKLLAELGNFLAC